jgi:hypothetical protein
MDQVMLQVFQALQCDELQFPSRNRRALKPFFNLARFSCCPSGVLGVFCRAIVCQSTQARCRYRKPRRVYQPQDRLESRGPGHADQCLECRRSRLLSYVPFVR